MRPTQDRRPAIAAPPPRTGEGRAITPGTRVLVRWAGVLRASPCQLHLARELPLFQNVGRVDRIDDRHGEHCVVVVFRAIPCPPFGEPWVDAFTPEELLPIV